MSTTLKRKLETGIVAYLKTLTATILDGYSFHESAIAEKRSLPGFVVRATGESEAFPGGSPRKVVLEIAALTSFDDSEDGTIPSDDSRTEIRKSHDDALAAVEAGLEAPGTVATLQAMLNAGATRRPVTAFHFYDITKTDEQPMTDGRQYGDKLTFEVVCQNCDG